MRSISIGAAAVLLISAPATQAVAQTAQKDAAVEIPDEFQGFFDGVAQLMAKYPNMRQRFYIGDRKATATKPEGAGNSLIVRSALCRPGQCCSHVVDEGSGFFCAQCTFCEP